ncbi:AraC family transcriptional regulator [Caenimonas sedimenti]|uniref:AraC family transcriptional regulator n=1 Tax=Caenimonas sedimenti TaxID=2596921 RepID=A0A562ZQG8_9BURK|nr:helix-turn-helix domain-containing protein [Caenimonas sedimenti]TWO70568.1 AraC family transcriptional regulator [Caenimonas sedimenti]
MRFYPAPAALAPEVLGVVMLRTAEAQAVPVPAHAAALFTIVLRGFVSSAEGRSLGAGGFAGEGSAAQARVLHVGADTIVATVLCRASILPRLSGEPARLFAGQALPAELARRPDIEDWMAGAHDDALVAARALAWAAGLLRAARQPKACANRFASALANWGSLEGGRVVAPEGWGERSWQRACRDELGVSPKLLARLARLHASVRGQAGATRQPWAEHAIDAGFSDQAHLARDYRLLAGTPPMRAVAHQALRLGASELAPRFFGRAAAVGNFQAA